MRRKLPDGYQKGRNVRAAAMRNEVDENPFNLLAKKTPARMMMVKNFMCIRLTLQELSCGSFFVK